MHFPIVHQSFCAMREFFSRLPSTKKKALPGKNFRPGVFLLQIGQLCPIPKPIPATASMGELPIKLFIVRFFAYLFCAAEVLRYYALRAAFHLPGKYSLRRGASVKGDTDRHRTHWKNMLLFMQPFAEKNAPALRRGGTRKLRLADEAFQHRTERSGCNIVSVN